MTCDMNIKSINQFNMEPKLITLNNNDITVFCYIQFWKILTKSCMKKKRKEKVSAIYFFRIGENVNIVLYIFENTTC